MDYCLIYEDIEGNCRVVLPEGEAWEGITDPAEGIQRLHSIAIPTVTEFLAIEKSALPTDMTFRRAWKKGDTNEPIKIDFGKALGIHRSRLEMACQLKIQKLNREFELAQEDDNLPQQVAVLRTKKILRGLHEMNLTHCKTPEDIKYSIPRELYDVWDFYPPERG